MIQLGAMPLPSFLKLHPDDRVTAEERATLKAYLAPWRLLQARRNVPMLLPLELRAVSLAICISHERYNQELEWNSVFTTAKTGSRQPETRLNDLTIGHLTTHHTASMHSRKRHKLTRACVCRSARDRTHFQSASNDNNQRQTPEAVHTHLDCREARNRPAPLLL